MIEEHAMTQENILAYLDTAIAVLTDSHETQAAFYFERLKSLVAEKTEFPTERALVADSLAL
jgi:hypothetical protein